MCAPSNHIRISARSVAEGLCICCSCAALWSNQTRLSLEWSSTYSKCCCCCNATSCHRGVTQRMCMRVCCLPQTLLPPLCAVCACNECSKSRHSIVLGKFFVAISQVEMISVYWDLRYDDAPRRVNFRLYFFRFLSVQCMRNAVCWNWWSFGVEKEKINTLINKREYSHALPRRILEVVQQLRRKSAHLQTSHFSAPWIVYYDTRLALQEGRMLHTCSGVPWHIGGNSTKWKPQKISRFLRQHVSVFKWHRLQHLSFNKSHI